MDTSTTSLTDVRSVSKIVCEAPTNGREPWNVKEHGNIRYEIAFKNGPTVKYDASVNGEFYAQSVEPFVYTGCKGKLWALDRLTDDCYFTLYPSGDANCNNGVLSVNVQAQGPFVTFALSIC